MEQFLTHFSYAGILLVLLISGLGVPLPEDLPLLIAGALCAQGVASLELMLPLVFAAVVGADLMIYYLGRRFGRHVPKMPMFRRFLDEAHLQKADRAFEKHGGKTLLIARFLPGVRTAVFFSAGACRIPLWKMLVFDGGAAMVSVPLLVMLGYFFGSNLDTVRDWVHDSQVVLVLGVGLLVVVYGIYHWRKHVRAKAQTLSPVAVLGVEALENEKAAEPVEALKRKAG
ncbi:MAG: DedA family protein [Phycisphaeraceae bacterium]|nr:DedA family protein [Phycisphaeraceae bacterium]